MTPDGEMRFESILSLEPLIAFLRECPLPGANRVPCISENLDAALQAAPELLLPITDAAVLEKHAVLVERLMGLVFPPVFWNSEPMGAVLPYTMKPFLLSPPFKELFKSRDGDIRLCHQVDRLTLTLGRAIKAYLFILNQIYGLNEDMEFPVTTEVTDPKTGLPRHYKFNMDTRFVRVSPVGRPPELGSEDWDLIKNNLSRPDRFGHLLPPEKFRFEGFVVIQAVEITESVVLGQIERDLIDRESMISGAGFNRLEARLRAFFRRPDLTAGLEAIRQDEVLMLSVGCQQDMTCVFTGSPKMPLERFRGTVYERLLGSREILSVPDVLREPELEGIRDDILEIGIRSILAAPLWYQDSLLGVLQIKSPRPGDFGPLDMFMLESIRPLFSLAIKKALDELDNQMQAVIKEKCTAIHPIVEWRFRKAALNFITARRQGHTPEFEPIFFEEVHPLFGAADVRGSATRRSQAISEDLARQMDLAREVVELARGETCLSILGELAQRLEDFQKELAADPAYREEESVTGFLARELEPHLPHLSELGPKVAGAVEAYHGAVDRSQGQAYDQRRALDRSVSILNERLAAYLDREDAAAQEEVPHYYERRRTDGVDYLIYAGRSLLETGPFNELLLQNLRLWQLSTACGLAWLSRHTAPELSIPLETTHLVLVQKTAATVRFKPDEKRFGVEGSYDIRHEIVRSRLEKAVVKGSGERLTQPEQLAVVCATRDERLEIERHLDHLARRGWLKGDPEAMEIADMPGVQGLMALRCAINLESESLGERVRSLMEATD